MAAEKCWSSNDAGTESARLEAHASSDQGLDVAEAADGGSKLQTPADGSLPSLVEHITQRDRLARNGHGVIGAIYQSNLRARRAGTDPEIASVASRELGRPLDECDGYFASAQTL